MENEKQEKKSETIISSPTKENYLLPISILIAAALISGSWLYGGSYKIGLDDASENASDKYSSQKQSTQADLSEQVLPAEGIDLPVIWGDLGARLVDKGAIDAEKFQAMYDQRGLMTDEYERLLFGQNNDRLKITKKNAGYLLNLFWALGLASSNPILETGEMSNPSYGGAGNFASTGGWTMSQGDAMDHYSKHSFFNLTSEQQALVDKVSRGIYRPCCGNSTHFPDCNHGMAMLGLLELMASQNVSEQNMWNAALAVNSYWFPDTYLTIATYMQDNGIDWQDVNPREILGSNYSSAQGYQRVAAQVVQPQQQLGGNGCSV
ncbi:MAG: hypothetical protein ACKKL5_04265 [Candidatus Komeilibacteria bacterium]